MSTRANIFEVKKDGTIKFIASIFRDGYPAHDYKEFGVNLGGCKTIREIKIRLSQMNCKNIKHNKEYYSEKNSSNGYKNLHKTRSDVTFKETNSLFNYQHSVDYNYILKNRKMYISCYSTNYEIEEFEEHVTRKYFESAPSFKWYRGIVDSVCKNCIVAASCSREDSSVCRKFFEAIKNKFFDGGRNDR